MASSARTSSVRCSRCSVNRCRCSILLGNFSWDRDTQHFQESCVNCVRFEKGVALICPTRADAGLSVSIFSFDMERTQFSVGTMSGVHTSTIFSAVSPCRSSKMPARFVLFVSTLVRASWSKSEKRLRVSQSLSLSLLPYAPLSVKERSVESCGQIACECSHTA